MISSILFVIFTQSIVKVWSAGTTWNEHKTLPHVYY